MESNKFNENVFTQTSYGVLTILSPLRTSPKKQQQTTSQINAKLSKLTVTLVRNNDNWCTTYIEDIYDIV